MPKRPQTKVVEQLPTPFEKTNNAKTLNQSLEKLFKSYYHYFIQNFA